MSILTAVRAATRPLHDALEADLDMVSRLTTEAGRRQVLAAFLGIYEPAEQTLAPLLAPLPALDYPQRLKAPRLRADLADLGLTDGAIAALPRSAPPRLTSAAEALGFAYVLEGATLGGRIIRRRVLAAGQPATGLSFFDFYGAETGPRWQAFCAVLETPPPDPQHTGDSAVAVVAGAKAGFTYVRAGLLDAAIAA